MAILDNDSLARIRLKLGQRLSRDHEPLGMNRPDLDAAVVAVDQWVSDNVANFNSALPAKAQSDLTKQQKAELLMLVVARRFEVDI